MTMPRWPRAISAEELFVWTVASFDSACIRKARATRNNWAKTMRSELDDDAIERLARERGVCYERLRRSRIILDWVMMLVFRLYWKTLVYSDVFLHLYIDASPQKRGLEMYATSFDLTVGSLAAFHVWRLMPQLCLGLGCTTLIGKTLALMWACVLLIGPDYDALRMFFSCVVSVCTDLGTEKDIVNAPDMLVAFLTHLGAPIPRHATVGRRLLPYAILSVGWCHLIDNLIRFVLCSLPWFPRFLKDVKCLIKLMYIHSNSIADMFDEADLNGAAVVVRRTRPIRFAEWRWGTLDQCCKSVEYVLEILRNNISVLRAWLAKLRDSKVRLGAMRAIESADFQLHFNYTKWFCRHMGSLQTWGTGCFCHSAELIAGETVDCNMKGRLVPYAYDKAESAILAMTKESNEWTHQQWGGMQLRMQLHGSIGALRQRAHLKLKFLKEVPYLFAKLGEPGVKEEIERQWAATLINGVLGHFF